MIYVKLAWKNLMRNRRRSLIAGTAIGIGLAALIFVDALITGMERNMVEAATSTFIGEGQIDRVGFRSGLETDQTINRLDRVVAGLRSEGIVSRFSPRVMSFGMISSAANVGSIELVGVDPDLERYVSEIDEAVVEGSYFSGDDPRDILIGKELADTLKTALGDRLVVTVAQVRTGILAQDLFRVSGIFRFNIPEMDRGMAFVGLARAQELLGVGKNAHVIALRFTKPEYGSDARLSFWRRYSVDGNEAIGWPVLLPQLEAALGLTRFSTLLTGVILFGVVALGIINTLFMSLHERMFEFGVLKAIGTRPLRIARMIIYEAGALAVLSIALGCVLGFGVTALTARIGIDYTGIEFVGVTFRRLLYPVLDVRQFIEYPVWVFSCTILVGLYPALYAAKMSPAGAMRRGL